ncbi:SMAD/FHA domain-containing protein [Cokeromyces recurvatus]|uniref:SMAD/FHA domain-containing protein n=1 Tax=Cokeromyces recurvatus TaxID=90255 RepID=UPI00221FE36D|nr:SMAD/FHA domain-containing protein [Cokeromyces recurvatus]KAI7901189.1 SMAD/FHA domain-containing protein [Cokeromyces recurvatus]
MPTKKKNYLRIVPHIDTDSRPFIFDIIEKEINETSLLKLGRFTDRNNLFTNRIAFKSKVVSRGHAEIWIKDNQLYIKDIGSSSGTFINRIRLSPANQISEAYLLNNGDIVQLGMDYQGGIEEMFRCIKMKIELNNEALIESPSRYGLDNFRNNIVASCGIADNTSIKAENIDECCICLYAIAPFQALFVAPCSHSFHFKCCYPLLQNYYPGFNCPLCRSYADLNASVSIDTEEVVHMLKQQQGTNQN